MSPDLARTLKRSLAILAALFAGGFLIRRPGSGPLPSSLQVLERQPLGKDGELVLLRAEGQPLLLAYGPSGVRFQRIEARHAEEVCRG